jgi:hypothetical protein
MEESLKKLQFKKEQIISLNDNDLNQVYGGVAPSDPFVVTVVSPVSALPLIPTIVTETVADNERNKVPEVSKNYIDLDNGKACLLDEVVIHAN